MPPSRAREPSIDRSSEYEEFIEKLKVYHEKRGTVFDPEPRIGNRHVDLLRLYNVVIERGGYDAVSSAKLAWRKLGHEFSLGNANLPALAFSLKTVYYKNLAAYEISTEHGKEPPPKEILEDISARGADLLTRTVENFKPQGNRDSMPGDDSDGAREETQTTPNQDGSKDKTDQDDPGSGGRATRGLRQAPPQRVLFQPDISSTRQARHASANTSSPQPSLPHAPTSYNNSSNPQSSSFTVANYEPRGSIPLTLRSVTTPASNPSLFRDRQRVLREQKMTRQGRTSPPVPKGVMLPGTGFDGPNIYVRTLLALRCGIEAEEDYALHHLVKISHERGDKYKFDSFPGLAEGLIEKALQISSLFYKCKWEISWTEDISQHHAQTLDGLNGTADIAKRIEALELLLYQDSLHTESFCHTLEKVTEAFLVLRNMVMLEENAAYLSQMWPIRDLIYIALALPPRSEVVELQHYSLDIAEQLTKYFILTPADPLYQALLWQLDKDDRGLILTSLKAIGRISMNLEENNRLAGVPTPVLRRICDWAMLDDEELVHACLDFLYQFTAVVENVEVMIAQMELELVGLVSQLVRLLMHGAKKVEVRKLITPAVIKPGATELPEIPPELMEQLLKFEEPDRSAHWLRACFEEEPDSDITQIALWQAYQSRFVEHQTPAAAGGHHQLLPAADFIKNVSTTFANASAQVVQGPQPKFIIKGIRPRHAPLDPTTGQLYTRCIWQTEAGKDCGRYFLTRKALWEHALFEHCNFDRTPDGKIDFARKPDKVFHCRWGACDRFEPEGTDVPDVMGQHFKLHLPADLPSPGGRDPNVLREAEYATNFWIDTPVDERGDAAGLPLTAALVLRNLVRNLPKRGEDGDDDKEPGWQSRLFAPVMPRLWYILAHNRPLATYVADLTCNVVI